MRRAPRLTAAELHEERRAFLARRAIKDNDKMGWPRRLERSEDE